MKGKTQQILPYSINYSVEIEMEVFKKLLESESGWSLESSDRAIDL